IIIERVGRLSGVTSSPHRRRTARSRSPGTTRSDPERRLPSAQQFPFATIVTKNYSGFDEASRLDRPGVFRLNIGVSAATFASLFATSAATVDASALDVLVPHPVYGTQHWVVILNPRAADVR